jgi:hypothetical protein
LYAAESKLKQALGNLRGKWEPGRGSERGRMWPGLE